MAVVVIKANGPRLFRFVAEEKKITCASTFPLLFFPFYLQSFYSSLLAILLISRVLSSVSPNITDLFSIVPVQFSACG